MGKEGGTMKTLASHIERDLRGGGWRHCAICEPDLQRLWPLTEKDREAKNSTICEEIPIPAEIL
jgi:hypothetical protein